MHYNVEDGLTTNNILAICEDREENLWFVGQGGAFRFDGFQFREFSIGGSPGTSYQQMSWALSLFGQRLMSPIPF